MSSDDLSIELERLKLISSVPEVRAAFMNNLSKSLPKISSLLAEKYNRDPNDIVVRSYSGAILSVTISVFNTKNLDMDFIDLLDKSLSCLEDGLTL